MYNNINSISIWCETKDLKVYAKYDLINCRGSKLMGELTPIKGQRTFSIQEAQETLSVIYHITQKYSDDVEFMTRQLESFEKQNKKAANDLEKKINRKIDEWQTKIERLGAIPRGLWLADFDSGEGYFCWMYPEKTIEHWHGYADGFSQRTQLTQKTKFQELFVPASAEIEGEA